MQVDKMSNDVALKLGDLQEAALYISADGAHIQANTAAIELMGEEWRACAAEVVAATKGFSGDGWHHSVRSCNPGGLATRIAVHATACPDDCQLILLDPAEPSDPIPSAPLEQILESVSDCFFALSSTGQFVYANTNAAEFFGVDRADLLGMKLSDMGASTGQFADAVQKTIVDQVAISYDAHGANLDSWIEVRAYPSEGGMACYFIDITDRVSSQERIQFMALHDSLTRLPNRRYMQEELIRCVARARRGQRSALLFLDMDRFKLVNDTVGHAAGDAVLLEFAGVVAMCVREEDMLARFGGDEFALLLGQTDFAGAARVSERIHEAVNSHVFRFGGHTFSLGVSIGVTLVDGTLDEGHVMTLADDAMYEAKTAGGCQTRYRRPEDSADSQDLAE
jgi:diguanylate cyclase (GGDEF)-like protein/PAS domain S-box-containing protein